MVLLGSRKLNIQTKSSEVKLIPFSGKPTSEKRQQFDGWQTGTRNGRGNLEAIMLRWRASLHIKALERSGKRDGRRSKADRGRKGW